MKMNEFLSECFNFLICFVIVVAAGYYLISNNILSFDNSKSFFNGFFKTNYSSNSFSDAVFASGKNTNYRNYTVRNVPKDVLDGAYYSNILTSLFDGRKIVFYIYDDNSNLETHKTVQIFTSTQANKGKYYVYAFTKSSYNGVKSRVSAPTKICNSLEECNLVRKKAVTHSYLTNFLENCGKTACIFKGKHYVQAKTVKDVNMMLYELKDW